MNARIPIYIMQYHNLCGKGRGCDKRVHFVIDNVGPEPHRHAYVVCIGRTICAVTPPSDDRFERMSLCVCVFVFNSRTHTPPLKQYAGRIVQPNRNTHTDLRTVWSRFGGVLFNCLSIHIQLEIADLRSIVNILGYQ